MKKKIILVDAIKSKSSWKNIYVMRIKGSFLPFSQHPSALVISLTNKVFKRRKTIQSLERQREHWDFMNSRANGRCATHKAEQLVTID